MKQPTVLEKLKELEAQRTALIDEAKKAALEKAEAAIAELNVLGFAYFLGSEHQPKAPRRKKSDGEKGARHTPSDTACGYCGFKTEPLHDKRSHRSQTKKRPFTEKELEQLGMTRV
jgi:hypothetical protein